jgi:hypothetical protein
MISIHVLLFTHLLSTIGTPSGPKYLLGVLFFSVTKSSFEISTLEEIFPLIRIIVLLQLITLAKKQ